MSRGDASRAVSMTDAMRHGGVDRIEQEKTTTFDNDGSHAHNAHSAIFAEVKVDEQLGVIRVTRVVSAVAAGRILNTKTASSQIIGGVVWGIGMALHEETLIDHTFGRIMNANIAEYHVPVNADVHDIKVIFVDEPDDIVNPLGIKGLGEIGIVGVAAAIANAIYHATGTRVRDLPITLDKLQRFPDVEYSRVARPSWFRAEPVTESDHVRTTLIVHPPRHSCGLSRRLCHRPHARDAARIRK